MDQHDQHDQHEAEHERQRLRDQVGALRVANERTLAELAGTLANEKMRLPVRTTRGSGSQLRGGVLMVSEVRGAGGVQVGCRWGAGGV